MPKKNSSVTYTSSTPERSWFMDYFLQKILPALIAPAIIGSFTLIAVYFRLQTVSDQVSANTDHFNQVVRKDVLEPQLIEINKKLDNIDTKLDRISERK